MRTLLKRIWDGKRWTPQMMYVHTNILALEGVAASLLLFVAQTPALALLVSVFSLLWAIMGVEQARAYERVWRG